MKWNHLYSQVDNWIWLGLAILVYVIAKYCDIPALNTVGGACLVKIKGDSPQPQNDHVPTTSA